jgi:tRNA-binding EMAP/Myf-like protein
VKPTSEPEAATLVVCKVHVGANSYEAYTNLKGIKKFAKLMVLKPDIVVQPLKKAKTSR